MPVTDSLIIVFSGLFGVLLGSFGNVLIFRVPANRSINGRSHCMHCKHVLSWFELIPVLSYLGLRGRCRKCHKHISFQYPLIELLSGCIGVLAVMHVPALLPAFFFGVSLWLLLVLAVIDGRTGTVPYTLSIPFVASSLLYTLLLGPLTQGAGINLAASIVIGAGFFGLQWIISRGRWVGSGDILLGAGVAALVGTPPLTLIALGLSYIIGAVIAVGFLAARKKTLAAALPFGPFLACGAAITIWYGDTALSVLGVS